MTSLGSRIVANEQGWRDNAACLDQPSAWFTDPADQTEVLQALATCRSCPVQTDCLTTALSHPAFGDTGIWGGTTEQTRHRIRTGHVTITEALQISHEPKDLDPETSPPRDRTTQIRRLPVPELTVGRTSRGTYESADGRTIIFRIHGQAPWMLMIDDRPIARADTLTEARRRAWATLHTTPIETREPSHAALRRR